MTTKERAKVAAAARWGKSPRKGGKVVAVKVASEARDALRTVPRYERCATATRGILAEVARCGKNH